MPNDKETLLGMGFDPARVECMFLHTWHFAQHPRLRSPTYSLLILSLGATKATGGRGLQPAMDHILENEGKPVPDLSSVSSSSAPNPQAMDVDEDDEDAEALRSIAGKGPGGTSAADLEARVSHTCKLLVTGVDYNVIISQSIKCSDCGKVFRNNAMASYHAEKSGHDQFEESTEEVRFYVPPLLTVSQTMMACIAQTLD